VKKKPAHRCMQGILSYLVALTYFLNIPSCSIYHSTMTGFSYIVFMLFVHFLGCSLFSLHVIASPHYGYVNALSRSSSIIILA
jgi:hypothetical protein